MAKASLLSSLSLSLTVSSSLFIFPSLRLSPFVVRITVRLIEAENVFRQRLNRRRERDKENGREKSHSGAS